MWQPKGQLPQVMEWDCARRILSWDLSPVVVPRPHLHLLVSLVFEVVNTALLHLRVGAVSYGFSLEEISSCFKTKCNLSKKSALKGWYRHTTGVIETLSSSSESAFLWH